VNEEKKVARRKDRREGLAAGGLRPHHNLGGRKPPTYRKKHPTSSKNHPFHR